MTDLQIFRRGLDDKTQMNRLWKDFETIYCSLKQEIDVSILEGITFSDPLYYDDAINNVDRGFQLSKRIKASVDGMAMTLHVNRNDILTAHIVFNMAGFDQNNEKTLGSQAITTIAHEMSHVEIMKNLHKYQHGMCFVKRFSFMKDAIEFEFSKASVEEYIACKKSAKYDVNNDIFNAFEGFLNKKLVEFNSEREAIINAYTNKKFSEQEYIGHIYSLYGQTLKILAYYLGQKPENINYTNELKSSLFFKYLENFIFLLSKSYNEYPDWISSHPFKEIQKFMSDILSEEENIRIAIFCGQEIYFT